MDIRTLRYFVEVVRQQSFTRAAEKLFVTQPTISKMLKNLEDELNCTLLIRDGRKLLLTDTGRVVFERGQAILGEFSQLESELSDINHLHKGVLRLGIPPMVGMLMARHQGLLHGRPAFRSSPHVSAVRQLQSFDMAGAQRRSVDGLDQQFQCTGRAH